MEYKFTENKNYEDFSCGRVIYHQPGFTNYPVRLASEIFQRCLELQSEKTTVKIYDPCCGGGYLLTILGLLHHDKIDTFYGSDIALKAVEMTKKNLNLLTTAGLQKRITELEKLHLDYQKESHLAAVTSAENLLKYTRSIVDYHVLERDILNPAMTTKFVVDIVITDVPYGDMVCWSDENGNPVEQMLDNLLVNLSDDGVIAISSDKSQKIANPNYHRIKKIKVGKRKVEFLQKI